MQCIHGVVVARCRCAGTPVQVVTVPCPSECPAADPKSETLPPLTFEQFSEIYWGIIMSTRYGGPIGQSHALFDALCAARTEEEES